MDDTCSECHETGKDMLPGGNEAGKPVCVECWVGDDIFDE